ncbi:hypothetical protein KVD47_04650 [Helicobacter pylori]|nr:hypothetical protein [Helicobacter pylori]WRE49633.1 hypothetical protein KVD47_04650 [Helicobacter pylori]
MKRVKSNILIAIVEALISSWCLARGHNRFICDWWGILVKNTKAGSYQFMDLNIYQNTKIQTLALFSLDIDKVLFLWDFYGIQEKYTKKTLAKP